MNDEVINYLMECISFFIRNGIEEESDKFKYTLFVCELDIGLNEIDNTLFDKMIIEIINYLNS